MNFWDRVNNTDVAGASARGFNAFAAGQEAAARGARNIEWSEQRPLRDALLQMQEEDAIVDMKLGRQVNNALNVIAENRADLYNNPTGYMNALNTLAPLQEGQTRVLSKDGKNIDIVGPDGQIMDSVPALKGKAAENSLLDMMGLNLRQRTRTLPQEQQYEAGLNARLAENMMRQQWELEKIRAGLRGMGMGGGRGMGGAGGVGSFKAMSPEDVIKLAKFILPQELAQIGIPLLQDGSINYELASPEQILQAKMIRDDFFSRLATGNAQGLPPVFAGANALGGMNRTKIAAEENAVRPSMTTNPSHRRGGIAPSPRRNPYADEPWDAPGALNRAVRGLFNWFTNVGETPDYDD